MTPEEIEAMMRKAHPVEEVVIRDFVASYNSNCDDCGRGIDPGDKAGYIDGSDEASCWGCCMEVKNA